MIQRLADQLTINELVEALKKSNVGQADKTLIQRVLLEYKPRDATTPSASGSDPTAVGVGTSRAETKINMERLLRKPKRFAGANEEARVWFQDYEFCCEMNDWSEEFKGKYFPAFLDGSALKWFRFQVQKGRKMVPFMEIREEFQRNYFNATSISRLGKDIDERRMKQNEQVNAFIAEMRAMLSMYDPNMSEILQIQKIKDDTGQTKDI